MAKPNEAPRDCLQRVASLLKESLVWRRSLMNTVRLTRHERSFLRTIYQDGAFKLDEPDNAAFSEMAGELRARGFVRAVKDEHLADEGAYVVLTGRGVITVESTP